MHEVHAPTLRSRIQKALQQTPDTAVLRGKQTPSVPRSTASPIVRDRPRSGTKDSAANRSGRGERVETPKGKSIVALAKALNQTLNLKARCVNLALSPDKSELLPAANCWDSPRYVSSPKEEEDWDSDEKEMIVSVLNSTVPSPEKTREKEAELAIKKQFRVEGVTLVQRSSRAPLPQSILIIQGADCLLYDVVLS